MSYFFNNLLAAEECGTGTGTEAGKKPDLISGRPLIYQANSCGQWPKIGQSTIIQSRRPSGYCYFRRSSTVYFLCF